MAVPSDSRFKFTPRINFATPTGIIVETYGSWTPPDFLSDPTLKVSQYTVPNRFSGRADLISYNVYGTPEYFWVIIAYNNVREPLNWPKTGDVIGIPDISAIVSEM